MGGGIVDRCDYLDCDFAAPATNSGVINYFVLLAALLFLTCVVVFWIIALYERILVRRGLEMDYWYRLSVVILGVILLTTLFGIENYLLWGSDYSYTFAVFMSCFFGAQLVLTRVYLPDYCISQYTWRRDRVYYSAWQRATSQGFKEYQVRIYILHALLSEMDLSAEDAEDARKLLTDMKRRYFDDSAQP